MVVKIKYFTSLRMLMYLYFTTISVSCDFIHFRGKYYTFFLQIRDVFCDMFADYICKPVPWHKRIQINTILRFYFIFKGKRFDLQDCFLAEKTKREIHNLFGA